MKYSIIFLALIFLILPIGSALSNESINAERAIENSKILMADMISRNISIERVNETLQDIMQLYSAQIALEEKQGGASYAYIMKGAEDIQAVYSSAIKAQDELTVFRKYVFDLNQSLDLSAANQSITAVETSFSEERFDDTLILIDDAYSKISEIAASQTTLRLFYASTKKNVKEFFVDHWKGISLTTIGVLILFLIFWKTIKKLRVRMKYRSLMLQKQSLDSLIKRLQEDYFKGTKISEGEYNTKLEVFKGMLRDIERQLPLLNESLYRLDNDVFDKTVDDKKRKKQRKSFKDS